MASPAQIHANQVNAEKSTGPKTAEGKARASRNNLRHGLTLGVLKVDPAEQLEFCEFEANLRAEIKPEGAFETEALQQFIDAAWRLRKIRAIVDLLIADHDQDPFVHPETAGQMAQLNRYRAAAEMIAYRAVKTLRELQTTRLARLFHLTKEEQTVIPPLVNPETKMMLDEEMLGVNDREIFYLIHGAEPFTSRFPPPAPIPGFANSNPNP